MAVVVVMLALSGAGCVTVVTEQPLYGEKDKVNDPALEGVWIRELNTDKDDDKVEIRREGEGSYLLRDAATARNEPALKDGKMVLFKLGPHYMIELSAKELPDELPKPEDRLFSKLALIEGKMFMTIPEGGAIDALLRREPTLVKHRLFRERSGNGGTVTLTDSTENMRAFILKCGPMFFDFPMEFCRRPKDAKVPVSTALQTKEQQTFEVMWLLWSHLKVIGKMSHEQGMRAVKTGVAELDKPLVGGEMDLLPAFALPASACDARVGRLYRDMRAALVAIRVSGAKIPKPLPNPKEDPEKIKANKEKYEVFCKNPLRALAADLAGEGGGDHPQREELERLAKQLDELTVEMEKKYEVRWR